MQVINQHQMRSILEYLDQAHLEAVKTRTADSYGAWCIQMARKRLLEAALQPVAVETVAAL